MWSEYFASQHKLEHNTYSEIINVSEYRRGNHKWTIQRNWQHVVHKTKTNKRKTQHNMFWTPPYTNSVNKT